MEPLDAANAVVQEHHPDARAAFLGGSVITDRRTATSDLDIVVLLHGAPAPYRLSVHEHGWPVELLVHTEKSWHAFVEREVRNRRSPLMWMCANGVLLIDRDGVGARISAHAKSLAAAGPPPTPVEEIEDRRYGLTDLLDDLAGCTEPGERLFICTELARRTAELSVALNTAWNGGGKWLARRLDATAPGLSKQLCDGVHQALEGRVDRLVEVVDEVLLQAGGRLWAGYRRSGTP
jgi:hypothetical protein